MHSNSPFDSYIPFHTPTPSQMGELLVTFCKILMLCKYETSDMLLLNSV